ncbi:MAG: hypothetical protein H5U12_32955 [Hoeflea sp.]|nr:hypothetical protein [Hoeflea sp.]
MKRLTPDELVERMLDADRRIPLLSALRHGKSGDMYRVYAIALDEATLEPVVIYAPENRPDIRFARPLCEVLAKFVLL